jgi:hypothetical protein
MAAPSRLRLVKREYAAGRRAKPVVCDGCQQDQGIIAAHSENYSKPHGDHIGQYGLCFVCHMMVHTRFGRPDVWQAYRDAVRAGAIFKPFHGRAFPAFAGTFLRASLPEPVPHRVATGPTLLDQIEAARCPQSTVA